MSDENDDSLAPLRQDVRDLGAMLGRVIRRRAGDEVYETVERVRGLTIAARKEDATALDELRALFERLPLDHAVAVSRAFAHFLALANIAEQHHRTRRRRAYQEATAAPQSDSLEATLAKLRSEGISGEELRRAVLDGQLEFVLTAHPTEINRRTVLQRHRRIAELLAARDRYDLTPREERKLSDDLEREIAITWDTDEILRRRPSPLEEANAGLLVFEQTLWEALPRYARLLDELLQQHAGEGLPLDVAPIRFGTWMGGDRDGNPNVTADTTRRVVALGRWLASQLYWKEIDALRAELALESAGRELRARVGPEPEPYRRWLGQIRERIESTRAFAHARIHGDALPPEGDEETRAYVRAGELQEDLMVLRRSLVETGQELVAEGRLDDLLRRLACFGLDLARLDIRQESTRHTEVLDAVTRALGLDLYSSLDEEGRLSFLEAELGNRRPFLPFGLECEADARECLDTFEALAEIESESLGAYVISMARSASDVLAVELLQRASGIRQPLRVVPLFETLDDLKNAPEIVARLLQSSFIQSRIAERGGRLEVMIGYSDSAKDAGLLAAAWELQRAQAAMSAVARAAGVELVFFHGRGGTIGRGGGPAHEAVRALPPGSVGRGLRVTVQGEVVQEQFGLVEVALRHCEQMTSALLRARLKPAAEVPAAWANRLDDLAAQSCRAYRGVVRDHPDFVAYFRGVTPEPELGELNVGSRPARRRASGGVESLRAIPWNFAWMQTRLLLPSWLGSGAALSAALADEQSREELRAMARDWPFFRGFVQLLDLVVAKVEPEVHGLYERVLHPPAAESLGRHLREAFAETRASLLLLREQERPLEDQAVIRRSIELRNPYVDPLNVVQALVLDRLRRDPSPEYRDALHLAVNGIAAGMRNTG
jgi:phosphoenolpyruvate carboxylase